MNILILFAIIAGCMLGWSLSSVRPLLRWGVPLVSLFLGGILMRQGTREIGVEAVQAGELSSTGFAGIMLVLLGLLALLTIVIVSLGAELRKSQRLSRRK